MYIIQTKIFEGEIYNERWFECIDCRWWHRYVTEFGGLFKAEGKNEHHKIEAIFKAFAKAIKSAVKRDPEKMILPSTKGML